MRFRIMIALASFAGVIALPLLAIGQPPDGKPARIDQPAAAVALDHGVWSIELATPANARLLTWSRFLGADLAAADAPLRAQLRLNDDEGFVVTGVKPDGAGAEGGLVLYDVLLGLNDDPKPDATYPFFVWRQGTRKPVTVKLRADRQGWIGVHLAEIDDALRSQLSLPAGRGLLVQEVTEDSPAKKAGLQQYDVIDGWNDGAPSGTVEEFSKVIQKSDGKALSVQILRHGKSMTINLTPQKRAEPSAAVDSVAAQRLWLGRVQPQVQWQLTPQVTGLDVTRRANFAQWARIANLQTGDDRQTKLSTVEKQLDQLLQELQAARQTIEEIRKLEERQKEKPADQKK